MNAKLCTFVLVLLGPVLFAEEPKGATRVVVLDNENLLEGEVSRGEGGYQVRRTDGGNLTIPVNRVLAVVATRQAAFDVVAGRANRRDADERLRLSRWCSSNGLPAEALAEARAALKMRPGFEMAERLVATLELAALAPMPKVDPAVEQAKAETSKPAKVEDVPALDYNSESYPLFATKVNAILNNACAACHAQVDMKTFRLTRAGGRSAIIKNLAAALPFVNTKDPAASPLLVKAVTPHGKSAEAPFKTKAHPAYETLELWVRFARSTEGTPEPESPLPVSEPKKLPDLSPPPASPTTIGPRTGDAFGQESTSVPGKPVKKQSSDPFDPAIFNGDVRKK